MRIHSQLGHNEIDMEEFYLPYLIVYGNQDVQGILEKKRCEYLYIYWIDNHQFQ